MLKFDLNRRDFVKIAAGTGAALAMPNLGHAAVSAKMIGIQVGTERWTVPGLLVPTVTRRGFPNRVWGTKHCRSRQP
jgi:hypothetical protein